MFRPACALFVAGLIALSVAQPSLAASAAVADTSCPTDTLSGFTLVTSTNYSAQRGGGGVLLSYDLRALKWSVSAQRSGGEIFTTDVYTLSGPLAGTPVALELRASTGGSFWERSSSELLVLQVFVDGSQALFVKSTGLQAPVGLPTIVDTSIVLNVTAGQPFRIRTDFFGGDYSDPGGMSAGMSFAGLPPGSVLRSCQGFILAGATPVKKTSWGELRRTYR
jgi:hypothetical protein